MTATANIWRRRAAVKESAAAAFAALQNLRRDLIAFGFEEEAMCCGNYASHIEDLSSSVTDRMMDEAIVRESARPQA